MGGKVTMLQSRHAWCYESRGLVYKTGTQVPRNFPKLTKGSVLTVTLSVGTVTFEGRRRVPHLQPPGGLQKHIRKIMQPRNLARSEFRPQTWDGDPPRTGSEQRLRRRRLFLRLTLGS